MDPFLHSAIKDTSIFQQFKEYLVFLNESYTADVEFISSFDPGNKDQIRKLSILVGYFSLVKFEKLSNRKPDMNAMVQESFLWFMENLKSAKSSQEILKSLVFSIVINSQGFEIANSLENIQSSFEIASSLLSDRDLLEFCRLTRNKKFAIYKQIFFKINIGRVAALTTISSPHSSNPPSFDVSFKSISQKSHILQSVFEWNIENCRIILSIIFSKLDISSLSVNGSLSPYESYLLNRYELQRAQLIEQIYDIFKNIVSLSGCNYLYMIPQVFGKEFYGICPLSLSSSLCFGTTNKDGIYFCKNHSEAEIEQLDFDTVDPILKIVFRLINRTQNDATQSDLDSKLENGKLEVQFAKYSRNSLTNRKKETLGTQSIEKANFRDKALQTYEKVENTCNTYYCKSTVMYFRAEYYSSRAAVFE